MMKKNVESAQGYNLIVLFSPDTQSVLLCRRKKEPYLGLSNFVGGHIEAGEDGYGAAYRELWEETAVSADRVRLIHLMDFLYPLSACYVEVYVGKLRENVAVYGDENELYWTKTEQDFFDTSRFAGEGNMGHIMEQIKINREILFREENNDSTENV